MRRFPTLFTVVVLLLSASACDSYVEGVDEPIDTIDDEQLTTEPQVPFLMSGVQSRFSTVYDQLTVFAGGISDELIFDTRVPNATFPTFREMDEGDIEFANNSNDALYNDVGELRFFSDNLLERIEEIEFEDPDLKEEAQFIGNFYGGIARYVYAAYYALTPDQPGGVITTDAENPGPFTPADQMYGQALEKLNAAKPFATDYQIRVINTLIARIHLFQGNYGDAATAAADGLEEGDDPFQSLHTPENTNYWYVQAGVGRNQWVVDFDYQGYIDADSTEANRILLEAIEGTDGTDTEPPTIFYRQALYPLRESPLPFATWQENELILAEVELRDGNTGSALVRVDAVRASHDIDQLGAIDLDALALERKKELFTMGLRLVDQRRFDQWHLDAGTWQYLPITQNERNGNPNF